MKRKTVTLCMIAKDEEATIGQTIKSALAVVDEIVVGDTGSSDNTRLIAEGYGARVVDVPWDDDFAAARNAVLAEARSDWILVLDADERLQPVRPVEMQRLLSEPDAAGYRVAILAGGQERGEESATQVRLFRNHPYVRYCYPVHETVEIALENWATARGFGIRGSLLALIHEGGPERAASRSERNRRLLREASREYPYEPYFAYCLATETLTRLEDEVLPTAGLGKTVRQLQRAWETVRGMTPAAAAALAYGPDLAGQLSAALIARLETAAALDVVRDALEVYPDRPELRFRRAGAAVRHLARGDDAGLTLVAASSLRKLATRDLEACLASAGAAPDADERWRDLYPWRYLGLLDLLDGNPDAAERRFDRALDVAPLYSHAWLGKAECDRLRGEGRRALGYYLRAVTTDERNLSAWLRGGQVLEELGFRDNAKSWRAKIETLFPEFVGLHDASDWLDEMLPRRLQTT
ncbi:MAG: glycosyltransferase [bacterium]|nr:glycosyltransferase [bacterium]